VLCVVAGTRRMGGHAAAKPAELADNGGVMTLETPTTSEHRAPRDDATETAACGRLAPRLSYVNETCRTYPGGGGSGGRRRAGR